MIVNEENDNNDVGDEDDVVKYLDLFVISQYEYKKEKFRELSDHSKYEILTIVKQFNPNDNRNYFWKCLFFYCVYEKKILIQSLIVSLSLFSIFNLSFSFLKF